MEKGDAEGFVGEMELKIRDYSAANDYTAAEMREGLTQQFKATFFNKPQPKLLEDQLTVQSYNDGRIYEIKINGAEFLQMKEADGSMQMAVYVGKVKSQLGIIR